MRRVLLLLGLAAVSTPCYGVTIMKNVGHSDCYVVISDGRIVVIDAGPASSAEGLVSLLKSEYLHYDRIVITHVHSDHAGGLVTAERYARQKGSKLSADMLVSNHGEHDIDVVVRESNVRSLVTALRGRPVVAMSDQALAKLAFADENMAIEAIALNKSRQPRSENASGLVLKVTEIRDGQRRATLFLGDIGKSEQFRLFSRPDVKEIFRDVHAVTLPHHGRSTTLHRDFFKNINRLAGPEVILLHSDRKPLDRRLAAKATQAGFAVRSTASAPGQDVLVNMFDNDKTFHVVEPGTTDLAQIVAREKGNLIRGSRLRIEEVRDAVSKFCNRPAANPLSANTVISWPSDTWILNEVAMRREEFSRETDRLIAQLQSTDPRVSRDALSKLEARRPKLSRTQTEAVDRILRAAFDRETDRLIAQLQLTDPQLSVKAETMLQERRPRLSPAQKEKVDRVIQEKFNHETEHLISRLESSTVEEASAAAEALKARRPRLSPAQIERVDNLALAVTAQQRAANEIAAGLQGNWYVERNPNVSTARLFLYKSEGELESSTGPRYVIEEGIDGIWDVRETGPIDSIGVSTPGGRVVRMKRPAGTTVVDRRICEYCGKTAYGWCTMRRKYVCGSHRYFTQGGTRWVCP